MQSPISSGLVQAAQLGGPPDIDALIEAIWPGACRLAYAIVGERAAAEDAAQEACVVLYRTIGSLRSPDAFRVWFYRIVVREASHAKKRQKRLQSIAVAPTAAAYDVTPRLDVWRALATLPQHFRDVVVLRYFEDLSSSEIAAVLRIPDGTVRFRLMLAMRRLRPLLDDYRDAIPHSNEVQINAI